MEEKMTRNEYIHFNHRYGWDINEDVYKTLLLFTKSKRKQMTILSYGCNLDNNEIEKLVQKYLVSKVQEANDTTINLRYDANKKNHKENLYI